MKVKWLGHSCFLITADNGLKIVTDPRQAGFKGISSYGPVTESPDIVTISHQHGNHNYTGDLQGNPEITQGTGKPRVRGIEFVGIPCYHDKVSRQQRGDNTIFYFTIDDIRVCHCGDLGHPLDDTTLQSLSHSVLTPMHFHNQQCNFLKYGVEDLVKLRPGVIQPGKNETEFTAGRLPTGQILILDPAL